MGRCYGCFISNYSCHERGHEVHVVTSNSIGPFIEKLDAITTVQ